MSAKTIAMALGGSKSGASFIAKCPAHDDRVPSLSLTDGRDGKILVYCYAGCSQANVIDALKARQLWNVDAINNTFCSIVRNDLEGHSTRVANALKHWYASTAAAGTLVENYLQSRGLILPAPDSLRFHDGLKHPSGKFLPTMVALVTNGKDASPMAIHRTFLRDDGKGKSTATPSKMMLGPCRGGVVRLAPAEDIVMIGEGIETCLSVAQATGLPAWAALSTSGLLTLDLPSSIRRVILLADGDDAGEEAARRAALRLRKSTIEVRIARPPRGTDFNDVLLGRTSKLEGAV